MTTPDEPQPERKVYDLTAMAAAMQDAEKIAREAYWESPEFHQGLETAVTTISGSALESINTEMPDNLSRLGWNTFSTDKMQTTWDAVHTIGGELFEQPFVYRKYFEGVRGRVLGELPHTDAVPLEHGRFGVAPTTLRLAWNKHGQAFFVRESEEWGVDEKDYENGVDRLSMRNWVEPCMEVDRIVHAGNDPDDMLTALLKLEGDENASIRITARKALSDMAKAERRASTGPDSQGVYTGEGSPRPHENLSASIFDTARLLVTEAKQQRGVGRLASKFSRKKS